MTQRNLRRLFESIARRDWEGAISVATEITQTQETRGNRAAARVLRDALNSSSVAVHVPTPLANIGLTRIRSSEKLTDVELSPTLRKELAQIIREHQHAALLRTKGFDVRKRLILSGPPGCGKSLTARALANELSLDFYVVRMDAVIGSYLGQTAANLRKIFSFAETNRCALLFDELDALGRTRGNAMDVAELDRVVIALMQELELSRPSGILMATSNLPKSLDRALWRRFDSHLSFQKPSNVSLRGFCVRVSQKYGGRLPSPILAIATAQPSYAEAEKTVVDYYRSKALSSIEAADGT